MGFKFKGLSGFHTKKGRGIFLYNFSSNKIKYFSDYPSLFLNRDKEITFHLKEYLSYSWNLPFYDLNGQKKSLFRLIFFNSLTKKMFLDPMEEELIFGANKDKPNADQNRYSFLYLDFQGYYGVNKVMEEQRNKGNQIFVYASSLKKQKLIGKYTDFDSNDIEKDLNSGKNGTVSSNSGNGDFPGKNVLYAEGFPYWALEYWDKLYRKYYTINTEIKIIENDLKQRFMSFYPDGKINLQPYERFFGILALYLYWLKGLKEKGWIIICDDNWTGFRISPFSFFLNYKKIFDQLKNNQNFIPENQYCNYYVFGENIVQGLNFSLLISCSGKKDLKIPEQLLFSPYQIKLFKRMFLNLFQKNYYDTYFFYLEKFYEKYPAVFIGPYIQIYQDDKSTDNIKENWEKWKIYSFYDYGVLPLKMRDEDIKEIFRFLRSKY